ncbi:MAG TPA: copper chaperone PCu(A)C [Phenylobacterium sp.]|uniref:copper chaperone PCu(A)C n=1 Tax=Phenylobacterium sp. TaxID=1871053 RepID=UPI002CB3F249|nr:copper chaperone PCu(A)C [Phenylobacterium sp.]HSV02994.1 copper chaperone PCu(A)C [Phenylobacterium sp.]
MGLALAGPASAAEARAAQVEVRDAWSRPAAAGATGAGYLTLVNHGRMADALIGAATPAARRVEIHRTRMAGGVMSMARVSRVAIPAGASVTLAPGGTHLMLIGLARAQRPGEEIPAVLSFASGARVRTRLAVRIEPPKTAMAH